MAQSTVPMYRWRRMIPERPRLSWACTAHRESRATQVSRTWCGNREAVAGTAANTAQRAGRTGGGRAGQEPALKHCVAMRVAALHERASTSERSRHTKSSRNGRKSGDIDRFVREFIKRE